MPDVRRERAPRASHAKRKRADEAAREQACRGVRGAKPSALSPMPEGLLHPLSKYEILDLFAYFEVDGKEE